MAPVLAVVLNAPAAVPVAGAALPLSFLIAFVAAALVGNTVVQFARELPSAGSFYTFNSRGLGPAAGFFTGWLFWIGYAVLAPGLFTSFGAFVHDYVLSTFHLDVAWWWLSLAAMTVVSGLSLRSIKASANLDLTMLVIEALIFLMLGVLAIATAGSGNTAAVFLVSSSPHGFTGVGLGVVFGLLSFIGFDAAATLGEETRNPRRSIPLAVMAALAAVGVFYEVMMYAVTAGYRLNDPTHMQQFLHDENPVVTLGRQVAPWLLQPIELAAIGGIFSCFLALHSTTVRVMFSMGRDRVLPASLGKVHARWYSPYRAIIAQTFFTVAVGLGVGHWLGPEPTGTYGFTGAIGTVAIVIVYMLSNIAHIRYFWRVPKRSILAHVIAPALSVVCLAYPLYSITAPGQVFPYDLVPIVVLCWSAAGAVLYYYYRAKSPEKIAAIGSFVSDAESIEEGSRMITIEGKIVFTELAELVDPTHTALVMVDMQRDFIEPDGVFGKLGIDLSMYAESRPKLAALLAAARQSGTLIIHLQNTALPRRIGDSPAYIRFNLRMHQAARREGPPLRYTLPGTPGHEFAQEFTPRLDEIVVPKYRSSGFWGTNLDMLLRSNGVKTVVFGGCTTEGCVESTARDAMFNDYYVVIAEDCVASDDRTQHAASMLLMRHRFDLARGEAIERVWRDKAGARRERA